MGSGSGEASSLWDWDSLLLQATPLLDPDEQHQQHQHQHQQQRDPRLTCPNYLAGRVPCACSDEEDEEEEGRNRKRSRQVAVRCQVPSCGADITALKGYHQRHKVCLQCATRSSVFVRNQEQRYCQQCGKFHPLCDFDEDKRSCRWKLERHNDRRRRGKTGEAIAPSPHTSNNNISEGTTTNGSDEALSETAAVDAAGKAGLCYTESHQDRLHGQTPNDPEQEQEDFFAANLALFLDDSAVEPVRESHASRSDRQKNASSAARVLNSAPTSTKKRSSNTYTSPCPTRRISFKFYDWNPADFPRRLREQILEWLANMPVELEGYIRSGCTILTLFIAMPETAWVKLREDWDNYLHKLINGSESGFWDKGIATVYFNDKVSYVDHGIISNAPPCERLKKRHLPVLEAAFPICMEAGLETGVTIVGKNLLQQNSSLLVGSEGKYLPSCLIEETDTILRVNVMAPLKHGAVLFEVKTEYGVSNFVPVLVADRKLCEEVGSVAAPSLRLEERQHLNDLVLDLGWVLRHAQAPKALPAGGCPLSRLHELLMFSTGRGWTAVTDRILEAMHKPSDGTVHLQVEDEDDYLPRDEPDAKARSVPGNGLLVIPGLKNRHRRRQQQHQQRYFYVKAAMCLVLACVGVCILLQQHPGQVLDLSASLRRCLAWSGSRTRMAAAAAAASKTGAVAAGAAAAGAVAAGAAVTGAVAAAAAARL